LFEKIDVISCTEGVYCGDGTKNGKSKGAALYGEKKQLR